MAEQPKPPGQKRRGPYDYLVCRIEEGRPIPLTSNGEDAAPGWPPTMVKAESPAKARAFVFAKLTERQSPEKRDAYTIDLLAIRAENLGHQAMAWDVTREVAR